LKAGRLDTVTAVVRNISMGVFAWSQRATRDFTTGSHSCLLQIRSVGRIFQLMDEPTPEPRTRARKRARPAKLVINGIEIQRPAVPPVTPLWRIERAVKIAVQKYAEKLAAET
jgi:hypothetical protein